MFNRLKVFTPLKNCKGINLVEVLISAFIILVVVTFTLQAFVGSKDGQNTQAQVSDAQQSATFSMAEITKTVRNAGYRVPLGTPAIRVKPGTLGHDTLIIYRINDAGTLDSTRYFLDHTGVYSSTTYPALMRKVNNGTPELFAEGIEDIDFMPWPAGVPPYRRLTVSITARTEKIDKHLNDYRRRTVSTDISMPNSQ